MGGKSLVLLGLLTGGLYTYFCINTHKDQLYAKLYPSSTTSVGDEKVVVENNLKEAEIAQSNLGAEKVVAALEEATKRDTQTKLQDNEKVLQQLEASTKKKAVVAKDDASFYFANEIPYVFNANLAENRSESEMIKKINQFCQSKDCLNDIKFSNSVKDESWSNNALNIVNYLADNDIRDGSLSIKDGVLKITGELEGEKSKENLQNLLNAFGNTIKIEDKTKIVKTTEKLVTPIEKSEDETQIVKTTEKLVTPIKESEDETKIVKTTEKLVTPIEESEDETQIVKTKENLVTPIEESEDETQIVKTKENLVTPIEEVKEKRVVDENINNVSIDDQIRQAQSEINILLQNAVINFKVNSSEILPASREILDQIILIVNKLNISVNADVLGYTDASGSKRYNKKLSQRRADSVKKYLINNGINISTLTAIGYGEENLIFAPYDKRNRRVEIYLIKGE